MRSLHLKEILFPGLDCVVVRGWMWFRWRRAGHGQTLKLVHSHISDRIKKALHIPDFLKHYANLTFKRGVTFGQNGELVSFHSQILKLT